MIVALTWLLLESSLQARGPAKTDCFVALLKLPAPTGYRYPVEKDVSDYWQFYRDEYGRQASCKTADLNGDGLLDYVSVGLRTVGQGFSLIILYSGPKEYEPRIVWEDDGRVYRAGDGRLEIVRQGRHRDFVACEDRSASFTLPAIAVDYFNRLPYSLERPGQRTKPDHRLFWSVNRGMRVDERNLCSAEDWARVQRREH